MSLRYGFYISDEELGSGLLDVLPPSLKWDNAPGGEGYLIYTRVKIYGREKIYTPPSRAELQARFAEVTPLLEKLQIEYSLDFF